MNPRVEYEMSEGQLKRLLDACRPTPVIMIGGYVPPGPQENANAAWAELGREMGFESMTVQPSERGERFFTAVPSETEAQRTARQAREAETKRTAEIASLEAEIRERENRLRELRQS